MTNEYIQNSVSAKLEELLSLSNNKKLHPQLRKALLYIKKLDINPSIEQAKKIYMLLEKYNPLDFKILSKIYSILKN